MPVSLLVIHLIRVTQQYPRDFINFNLSYRLPISPSALRLLMALKGLSNIIQAAPPGIYTYSSALVVLLCTKTITYIISGFGTLILDRCLLMF